MRDVLLVLGGEGLDYDLDLSVPSVYETAERYQAEGELPVHVLNLDQSFSGTDAVVDMVDTVVGSLKPIGVILDNPGEVYINNRRHPNYVSSRPGQRSLIGARLLGVPFVAVSGRLPTLPETVNVALRQYDVIALAGSVPTRAMIQATRSDR